MQTIQLSRELVHAYREAKLDLSYTLSELLGYLDYRRCSRISRAPMAQRDPVEVPVDDAVYRQLEELFDGLSSRGGAAEILLWANFFQGGTL